jgi:hypothetical protein
MIKTTRSRLEIRQEPDRKSSVVGSCLVAVAAMGCLHSLAWLIAEWAVPLERTSALWAAKLFAFALAGLAGWILLRRRARVVLDLDHRMVARYSGGAVGGNSSWDLADFSAVILVGRERRRMLKGFRSRSDVVCLRRPDGSDLELYWAADPRDGVEIAARVASFTGLPYFGPRPS